MSGRTYHAASDAEFGLRSVCSLDLHEVPALAAGVGLAQVLTPGDIVFLRTGENWIARLIAELDGHWTHCGIYVGLDDDGRPAIVHAQRTGVIIEAITDAAERYEEGVAFATPTGVSSDARQAASDWARGLADAGASSTAFGGADLGEAFMLLRRARKRANEVLAREERGELESIAQAPDIVEQVEDFESTCSGLVYMAYLYGARIELPIATCPGVELKEGRLHLKEAPNADPVNDGHPEALGAAAANLQLARIIADAGVGMASSFLDDSIEVERGVTPNDLWTSTAPTSRRFWTENHRRIALVASAGCPGARLAEAIEASKSSEAIRAAVEDMIAQVVEGADTADAITAVARLRESRRWGDLTRLGEAFISRGDCPPLVLRQYAQALIEQGALSAAEPILEQLLLTTEHDQRGEVLGLKGRAAKQRFVGYRRSQDLQQAIAAYAAAFGDSATSDPGWHGGNLVALLVMAERHKIDSGFATPLEDVLHIVLRGIDADRERRGGGPPTFFEQATRVELLLAGGRESEAAEVARSLCRMAGATAFEVASFRRQLREIWELGLESEVYRAVAEATLADGGGAPIDCDIDKSSLQTLVNSAVPVPFDTYLRGLYAARNVCMITDRGGAPRGSGFVVRGRDLADRLPDEPVLVTCAHVVSSTHQSGALRPARAQAIFEELAGDDGRSLRVKRLSELWTSTKLDATVLRMHEPEGTFEHVLEVAPHGLQLEASPQAYVYVVGHPTGQRLSLSIRGNNLLAANETVLHYAAPTAPGSSGGSVFDSGWEVVGVHRAGSDTMRRLDDPTQTYPANAAVTLSAIQTEINNTLGPASPEPPG